MAKPIRKDDPDPAERETAPLTQAMRLAVGLGALPLIGLGLLFRGAGLARPWSAAAEAGETPATPLDAPRHKSELPSRDDVETALRTLTDATLPKAAPARDRNDTAADAAGPVRVAAAVSLVTVALALSGCRGADPACAGRTAADFAPTESQFGAMSPDQRRADAARFNELARRCGWEP